MSILSNGPIIHDVTDIDETSSQDLIEPTTEIEAEATEDAGQQLKESPLISEVFATDIPEIPIAAEVDGNDSLADDGVQPDV